MSELRLGGIADISEMSGLTRQAVNERAIDRTWGFPEPIAKLRMGRVWDLDLVAAYVPPIHENRPSPVTIKPRDTYPRLGGLLEVAELVGRPKTVVCNWADRGTRGFPVALAAIKSGRVWDMSEVEAWLRQHPEMSAK